MNPSTQDFAPSSTVHVNAFNGHFKHESTLFEVILEYPVIQSVGVLATVVHAFAPSEVHLVQVVAVPIFEYPSKQFISVAEVQSFAPSGQALHTGVASVVL